MLPAASPRDRMMPEFIFDREEETQGIRQRLAKKRPFLIHGPAGVGKTLLLRSLLPEFPSILYCEDSATTHVVFRSLARSLLRLRNPRAQTAFRSEEAIKTKSAVSLKRIVMDALHEGEHSIVLDHLKRPSHSFAAVVREIMGWGSTPVNAVARSGHMEDTGFLQPLYSDRSEKYELRNFETSVADQFARELVKRAVSSAPNLGEFLDKVLEFSEREPRSDWGPDRDGELPKVSLRSHIKITPLYIDFRMNWKV